MRLAEVSPSTAAAFRCAYVLPLLGALALLERRRLGPRARRDTALGWLAGLFFALDLSFWHHSIAAVGAGLEAPSALQLAGVGLVLAGVVIATLAPRRVPAPEPA